MAHSGRVVVVGGGASGLMAAGQAAASGVPVLLLERTSRLGTKLRITGKGRCNLTNTADLDEFLQHFAYPDKAITTAGGGHIFLRNAFARFSNLSTASGFPAGVPIRRAAGRFRESQVRGDRHWRPRQNRVPDC